jgi:transcriptional regulator with XRE-family HTH domain
MKNKENEKKMKRTTETKLKELQKKLPFTIEETAKKLNMPKSTYNQYLIGYNEPNIKTLIKLADFFDVTIDELVGREKKSMINTPEKNQLLKRIEQLTEIECHKLDNFAQGLIINRVADQKERTLKIINELQKGENDENKT